MKQNNKKTKVLVIGALPPPTGGMEIVMQQICNLHSKEYEIIPFNVSKNKTIKSNILINLSNFIYRCIKLFITIIKRKPVIVHIHVSDGKGFWQKAVYFKISKFLGKKTILHMHGANFREFYKSCNSINKEIITSTLKNSDNIIVLSESWKIYYSKISKNNNIIILNNAVEDINLNSYKRIYAKDDYIVLFLSNVCKRKGAYDLIKVIKSINNTKIKFVFAGPYEDKEGFFKEVDKLGIRDKCKFIGEVIGKERFKYFASADVFVLPSYAEGLPVAILEAMFFGLPIISTNVGAIPEVITKDNGILIRPGDTKELKNAIVAILNNKQKINYHSNNMKKINNNFTQPIFKSKLFEIYETLK